MLWERLQPQSCLKSRKLSAKSLGCFPSWGMAAWALFDSLAMTFLACWCLQEIHRMLTEDRAYPTPQFTPSIPPHQERPGPRSGPPAACKSPATGAGSKAQTPVPPPARGQAWRGRGDKARPPASRSIEPHPAPFFTVESVVELGRSMACRRSTASCRAHRRNTTQILWSTYFVARI